MGNSDLVGKRTYNDDIYHYMKFYKFQELLKTKSLCFVNPLTEWKDKTEGYLFRLLSDLKQPQYEEYKNFVVDIIKKHSKSKGVVKRILELLQTGNTSLDKDKKDEWFNVRCQSWSYSRNCLRMWDEYAGFTGVCIATTRGEIKKSLKHSDYVVWNQIEYFKNLGSVVLNNDTEKVKVYLEEVLNTILGRGGEINPVSVFMFKDCSYKWENEYRIGIMLNQNELDSENKNKFHFELEDFNFIKSVRVHPFATDEICLAIKKLSVEYGFRFEGKADLEEECCCYGSVTK